MLVAVVKLKLESHFMINLKRSMKSAKKFALRFIRHEHQFHFKCNMIWIHENGEFGYGEILECKYCGKELRIKKARREQMYD